MATIYEPTHDDYLEESDVRRELARVFDVCHGCRRCVDFCGSFPTLFEMIEGHVDQDSGRMTPEQQDQVVSECFQCNRCSIECPYTPTRHELEVDLPRLMLRAKAMRHANGHVRGRERRANRVMGRTEQVGKAATTAAAATNALIGRRPNSLVRRAVAVLTGASAVRLLPNFTRQRFSTWFALRPRIVLGQKQASVTVFPTCVVEYQEPEVGKDLVKVYERNGIECSVSRAGCCGAPWLHAGDVERFTEVAEKNVRVLADEIRSGTDVVVPQPTCSFVMKTNYRDHVGGHDADLVAEHTYDAIEYLMRVHMDEESLLDTHFLGDVPSSITYHAPCHLRAQDIGLASRDLMKLTGASVRVVQRCSGIDGTWGFRAGNEDVAIPMAERLGDEIRSAGDETIAGDCHLANTAIVEQTGQRPVHPIQMIARAYGIPDEDH